MELTDEDLLSGDIEAIRTKVGQIVDEKVNEKVKAAGQLSPERQAGVEAAKKAFAVFADDDADLRDIADELLDRAVRALPDTATEAEIKAAAEAVSKKLAKLNVEKQDKKDGAPVGPVPTGGGSAAAAHVNAAAPRNIEEAEAVASRIATDFSRK